jgi:hypothetical protein
MGHNFKPTKTKSGLRCINKATGLSTSGRYCLFDSFSFDTIVRGVTIPLRATRQVPNIQVTCMWRGPDTAFPPPPPLIAPTTSRGVIPSLTPSNSLWWIGSPSYKKGARNGVSCAPPTHSNCVSVYWGNLWGSGEIGGGKDFLRIKCCLIRMAQFRSSWRALRSTCGRNRKMNQDR